MKMDILKKSKVLFVGLLVSLSASTVAVGVWTHLGSRTVNWGLDHDKIVVRQPGTFTKLKVQVTGSLNMHRMVVRFDNGGSQEISLKHNFVRGADSRIIDLRGNKRNIKSISFWYDTKNRSRRRAKVHVYGRR
jgi:hypothetical protein